MACISGKVKHACCSVCLFIVVLALEQHTIPSVLAQDETSRIPMELMSWGSESPKTELQLGEPSTSTPSLVVLLVNDVPWTDSTLGRQSGRFTVRAPRGHGLMAVIQILNLRSETDNGGSLVCKDYMKFSDGVTGVSTPNICGELKKENKSFIPENLIGPRVFHSPSGKMEIVYESDKGEDPDSSERQAATSSQQKSRHVVEIVFTAYSDCLLDTFGDQIKCGDKCISHVLSCDEHINCGFEENFASDEVNCAYQGLAASGRDTVGSGRPPYLVTLYLAAFLFVCIIIAIAFYHRHTTYQRIKNIPT